MKERVQILSRRTVTRVVMCLVISGCMSAEEIGGNGEQLRTTEDTPSRSLVGEPYSATGEVYLVLPESTAGSAEAGYYAMDDGPGLLGHRFQSGATYTVEGRSYGDRVVVEEARLERTETILRSRSSSLDVLFVPLWRTTESLTSADLDLLANDVRAHVFDVSGDHLVLNIDVAPSRVMAYSNDTDLCDGLKPWRKEAKRYLRDQDIRWRQYDHVVVLSEPVSGCEWGGWGRVSGRWSSAFSAGLRGTILHELGHNFGLGHASRLDCTSSNLLLALRDELADEESTACSVSEYGDWISEMGRGSDHFGLPMSDHLQCKYGGFPFDPVNLDNLGDGALFELTPLPGAPTVAAMSACSWDGDVTFTYSPPRVRVHARRGQRTYMLDSLSPGDVFATGPNRRVRFVNETGTGRARMEISGPLFDACPPEPCPTYCAPVADFSPLAFDVCVGNCAAACAPATCSDGVQNQSETGIDCGGECPGCLGHLCTPSAPALCVPGAECIGDVCVTSDCPPDPCDEYCANIGFGGPAFYALCLADCQGDCSLPTCSDGVHNGSETGPDCGGTCPDACPTCFDGIENGDETGVDCGGSCLDACPVDNCPTVSCAEHCDTGFGGPLVYQACMAWCVPECG